MEEKEPIEYEGREEVIRFKQLLHYAVSEEIITFSRAAYLASMNMVDFKEDIWIAV